MEIEFSKGELISGFLEVHDIKKGGFGVVYIVYDIRNQSPFALKSYSKEIFKESEGLRELFIQECSTWINLDYHPNITTALAVNGLGGNPFLLMEYVSGGTLQEVNYHLSTKTGIRSFLVHCRDFCEGATFLYKNGIEAHSDIKPSNLLISSNNRLKIADFGLTKPEGTSTNVGIQGTLPFMAPELFTGNASPNFFSDIYAFGITMFYMITKKLPFLGRDVESFSKAHSNYNVPDFDAPELIKEAVLKCLKKDPTKRFKSIDSLNQLLEEAFETYLNEDYFPPQNFYPPVSQNGVSLNKAGSLLELKRFEEAISLCEEIIEGSEIDQELSRAYNLAGEAIMGLEENLEQAFSYFKTAIEYDEKQHSAWHNLGWAYRKLGRLNDALNCYDEALKIWPKYERPYLNKALVYRIEKNYDKAIDCLRTAISLNKLNVSAYVGLFNVYIEIGEEEKALKNIKKAYDLEPWDPQICINFISTALTLEEETEKASQVFNRLAKTSFEILKGHWRFWHIGSSVYNRNGEYLMAIKHVEIGLKLVPNEFRHLFLLELATSIKGTENPSKNLAYTSRETHMKLIPIYMEALELSPSYSESHRLLAKSLMGIGDYYSAKDHLHKSILNDGKNATAFNDLGVCFIRLGDYKRAREAFLQAIELKSDDPMFFYNLADSCIDTQEFNLAIEYFQKAIKLRPAYPEAWHSLGICHMALNNFSEAIRCYDITLSIDSQHRFAELNKAKSYAYLGDVEKSLYQLDLSIKKNTAQKNFDVVKMAEEFLQFLKDIIKKVDG